MKLHRTSGRPDWAKLKPSQMNLWQKIAARTAGLVTPGNLATVLGAATVTIGFIVLLRGQLALGLALLLAGRLFDLLDGWMADRTGTKSPLGEIFDATADKLLTFFTFVAAGFIHAAPWWFIGAMLIPHALIALIALHAKITGRRLHPSRIGKLSMAVAWAGVLLLIAVVHLNVTAMHFIAYAAAGLSIILALYAAFGYLTGRD